MTKYLIDTNFLARILIKDNDEQLNFILDFINKAVDNKFLLFVDKAVIFELVYVLSGNIYGLSKIEVKNKINSLLDLECFTFEDHELIIEALNLYEAKNLDIVDTYLICRAFKQNYSFQSMDKKAMKVFNSLST